MRPRPNRLFITAALILIAALACNAPLGSSPTATLPPPPTSVEAISPPTETQPSGRMEPTAEPPPTELGSEPASCNGIAVSYERIAFCLDYAVASTWRAEIIPANDPGEQGPYWDAYPEHVQFTFDGYALPDTFHTPAMYVYPVTDFEAISEGAARTIADFRTLMATRPAAPESIPFLPIFNAAQLFRARVQYLDFQNGSGVRFLTEYAQYTAPINNHDLFYTFQGMTADGTRYVALILPVSHPSLPADPSAVSNEEMETISADYEGYLAGILPTLDAAAPAEFTPNLDLLDALVRSLRIE